MEKINYKKEYEKLVRLWNEASLAYNKQGKPQADRARAALRILGFTTGKRPIKNPCQKLLTEYQTRVSELSQTTRVTKTDQKNIINDMAETRDTSYEAIHKKLRKAISEHLKAIKEVYNYSPVLLEKAAMQYRNILPPHK
jgi:hypothetical protein